MGESSKWRLVVQHTYIPDKNKYSDLLFNVQVDYSSTCDEKIPTCKELAAKGKIHDALDQLLTLEKQTRTGADMVSTSRVLVAIVQICFEAKDWVTLNDHVALLAKRRYIHGDSSYTECALTVIRVFQISIETSCGEDGSRMLFVCRSDPE